MERISHGLAGIENKIVSGVELQKFIDTQAAFFKRKQIKPDIVWIYVEAAIDIDLLFRPEPIKQISAQGEGIDHVTRGSVRLQEIGSHTR
jgi:hypothetical protein